MAAFAGNLNGMVSGVRCNKASITSTSGRASSSVRRVQRDSFVMGGAYPMSSPDMNQCLTLPYPGAEDDYLDFASSYSNAFNDARPSCLQTEGLQEFAGSLWERRRHIPSKASDPLMHVFSEFDADNDGRLSAREIAVALQSRGVQVTVPQIQDTIDAYEERKHSTHISAQEWPDFVFALAAADLKKDHSLSSTSSYDSYDEELLSFNSPPS